MFKINLRDKFAAAVAAAMLLPHAAMATPAFTVPAEVGDAKDAVLLVGAAVFSIAVGIRLYKWIKRAL